MKRKLKHETPIRIICAVLFATFSFLYISLFQGELLALIQDHLAQGQTSNNTFLTASLITVLLMALQYFLNKLSKLHGGFEALSYLPSCVLLAQITKVDATYSYSPMQWIVVVVVVAVLYTLIVWVNRNMLQARDAKFLQQLIPNLGVLTALFVFTGWYGNNTPAEHMELAAWEYAHNGEYDKVLGVGKRSDDYNADLTALRNLALAKTGQLGDKLFAYPQPYGSDGLMMNRYNVQTPSYGAKEYYAQLGAQPYGGERAAAFYKRVMRLEGGSEYANLYAAALLLDKDLDAFVAHTTAGKDAESLAGAPVHYQEAWMIYNEQHPFAPVTFVPDGALAQRYQDYLALREKYADDPVVMSNLCKRRFGKTYWYYYDFMD